MSETYSQDIVDEKFKTQDERTRRWIAEALGPINTKIAVLMTMQGVMLGGIVKLVFFP